MGKRTKSVLAGMILVFVVGTFVFFSNLTDETRLTKASTLFQTGNSSAFQDEKCRELTEWERQNTFDVVYAWVNGTDPEFQASLDYHRSIFEYGDESPEDVGMFPVSDPFVARNNTSSTKNRYADKNELLFSLRSLEKYMPWVENIFIVTNGQVPSWLKPDNGKVRVIPHEELFDDKSYLPVFSSNAIEANFHKIPFTTPKFLYFNDDMFVNSCVYPTDFHTPEKGDKIRYQWRPPKCAPGCEPVNLVNGKCDLACNSKECNYDNGECEDIFGYRPIHGLPKTFRDLAQRYQEFPSMRPYRIGLLNSNSLLAEKFGPARDFDGGDRRAMSHQPYFFDVEAYKEVREEFFYYFDKNSKNKFRHPRDMIVHSLYSHYVHDVLINEPELFEAALRKFDENGDGLLDTVEFNNYAAEYCVGCFHNKRFLHKFWSFLTDETYEGETYRLVEKLLSEFASPGISINKLTESDDLVKRFRWNPTYREGGIAKYKNEYIEYSGVYLKLKNKISKTRTALDNVKNDRETQFFCLNDGITLDEEHPKRQILEGMVNDFYLERFPNPSSAEDPHWLEQNLAY